MSIHCRTAFLSLALIGLASTAVAQKAELPNGTLTKPLTPKIEPKVPLNLGSFQHDYSGGDLATYWISPLLTNHDSRISNNVYSVDGKQYHEKFGFSVVNSSLEPLEVSISCQNAAGAAVPKYSAKLKLAAYGAASWDVSKIAPERSSDSVTMDSDQVWCGLTANRPFAAFGTMWKGVNVSGYDATSSIDLVAAAR